MLQDTEFVCACTFFFLADSVYLCDENQREEYVRNDFGLLYKGTAKNVIYSPWGFDQVRTASVWYFKEW